MIRTLAVALATTSSIMAFATPAAAQTRQYDIPAGSLKGALDAYARQSGRQLVYRGDEVRSARSGGVRGEMSADAALAKLLAGSGFTTRIDGKLIAIVKVGNDRSASAAADAETVADESEEILVTGSRIAGGPVASPLITVSKKDIVLGGFDDLGDVMRSIPQNFSGGQNPGINFMVPVANGENIGSGSAFNLRGLGADSTLVLLNGKRLVYGGYRQAIDIDSIPLEAVQRMEILTDGASALYGSDAVGGVVNVILDRTYSGFKTSARIGGATEGGAGQLRLGVTVGTKWASGSLVGTYQFSRDGSIESSQRSYTSGVNPFLTLYPSIRPTAPC